MFKISVIGHVDILIHAKHGGVSAVVMVVIIAYFFCIILMKAVKGLVSSIALDLVCVPIKVVWFLGSSKLAFRS